MDAWVVDYNARRPHQAHGHLLGGQLLTVRVEAELFHVYHDGVLLKTVARTTRNEVVRFGPRRPPRPQARGGKQQPRLPGPTSTKP